MRLKGFFAKYENCGTFGHKLQILCNSKTPCHHFGRRLHDSVRGSCFLFYIYIFFSIFPVYMWVSSPLDSGWILLGEGDRLSRNEGLVATVIFVQD